MGRRILVIGGGESGVLFASQLLRHVRVGNMSAFPDDPHHFVRWIAADTEISAGRFVARRTYGRYLNSLVSPYVCDTGAAPRMQIASDAATTITRTGNGILVQLANGAALRGNVAVLCTGL